MMIPFPHQRSARRTACGRSVSSGFTLTELLVVILIIAVLAVVVFTLTNQVLAKARQAGCVSAMHQVGIASAAFIVDNNDRMPGPIQANGQLPNYTNRNGRALFSQLATYLGLEEKNQPTGLPDSLVCPAFRQRFSGWNANGQGNLGGSLGTPGGSGRVFYMNQDLVLRGKRVFGPQEPQAANQTTMNYSVVADGAPNTPVGRIVMLMDFEPIMHGKSRNYLFLDFHVETLRNTRGANARPN
jgi:prepilin-type N-terminal cleavage/methylation domain-containing protein/prepilin-type processing-associated H-X9-DG protein